MAAARLSVRLIGITAICLAALLLPLPGTDRVLVLAAFSLGLACASVLPGYDRWAAWLVGPAVLVLALAPVSGTWSLAALVALALLGFACFSFAGMERAVPALGLPLFTFAFRTGTPVDVPLFCAWLAAVVAMVIVANQASPIERGPRLGQAEAGGFDGGRADLAFGRRRIVQAVAVIAVAGLLGLGVAERALPTGSSAGAAADSGEGGPLRAHPGLTGGLDAGAPVELGDEVVLRVEATHPRYWRGLTYDDWDGRHWSRHDAGRPVVWSSGTLDLGPAFGAEDSSPTGTGSADGGDGPADGTTETQHFTVTESGLDVVLGAWRMTGLTTDSRAATVGDDGSVVLAAPLAAGASWTVTSSVGPASADDLRRLDPRQLPAGSPLRQRYAQEDDVSARTADLARQITADAPTTYDQVLALEAWIDGNVTYTRQIPTLADGVDVVDDLLFQSRQGFCEQIGSALVVMLRSLGVPARLVVGYVPGSFDADRGQWLSRGTDAHAWAEVYFPGAGWQGFDPTAGVALTPGLPAPAEGGRTGRLMVAVAVGSVVAAALRSVWRRRRAAGDGGLGGDEVTRTRVAPELVALQRRFDAYGQRLGRSWPPTMTLREKGDDLIRAGVAPVAVAVAVAALEQAWFARPEPGPPADVSAFDRLEAAVTTRAAYPLA